VLNNNTLGTNSSETVEARVMLQSTVTFKLVIVDNSLFKKNCLHFSKLSELLLRQ